MWRCCPLECRVRFDQGLQHHAQDYERGDETVNINKNDVLTFLAAVASIINVIMNWLA